MGLHRWLYSVVWASDPNELGKPSSTCRSATISSYPTTTLVQCHANNLIIGGLVAAVETWRPVYPSSYPSERAETLVV